ncbi:hypothetical protein [Deinococcus radiotolerans]|nr:hypothetical protein [Deinococcus radiotolerans]
MSPHAQANVAQLALLSTPLTDAAEAPKTDMHNPWMSLRTKSSTS